MRERLTLSVLAFAFFSVALAFLAAPEAGAASHRVVAWLDEPFEINGQVYPGGQLAVRQLRSYNPSSTLVEVWVDSHRLGVLLAAETSAGERSDESSLIFERDRRGHLVLVGFAYRGLGQHEFFQFRVDARGGHWLAPSEREERSKLIASK
jgi:hypothetical protein